MTKGIDPIEVNTNAGLFEDLPQPSAAQAEAARVRAGSQRSLDEPRLREPNRAQVELRASDLESLLEEGHRARMVWGYVAGVDLSVLLNAIKARGTAPGRAAIDPRILFALWLYATLEGVGSGREVTRLSREHDAYRWICGGVPVNYHALNDFRTGNDQLMDELLSDNVAALAEVGAIVLERVAQDGMRVRAAAGAASFRRQGRLEEHLAAASELVRTLKAQVAVDPAETSRRAQAAKLRAARQREECIRAALERLPEVAAIKQRNGGKADDARASTSDADASVMKMGDGGFRPAYNVQFASDCAGQVIVGMEVVTAGSDMAQLAPMVDQVEQRVGKVPEQWLVDGGFPAHDQLDAVAGKTAVYAPVPKPKQPKNKPVKLKDQSPDRPEGQADNAEPAPAADQAAPPTLSEFAPKPGDSAAVAQWRSRMNTDDARALYKNRAATAECVNAQARNRGLRQMPVRGLSKVKCVVRLFVLAHNLLRTAVLAPQLIGWGTGPSTMIARATQGA